MPLSFETKTISVKSLLSGSNLFRMPAFQRPYSWEEETAAQLLDDLHSAFMRTDSVSGHSKAPHDYFLGPLIVVQNGKASPVDIVDGQQRLATLCIILAVLRDLSDDRRLRAVLQEHLAASVTGGNTPRVQLRDLDQSRFEDWVVEPGGKRRFELIADRILDKTALSSAKSELFFSEDEEQTIVEILTSPISPKKPFLRPLLLRLNAAMPDPEAPIHFPTKVTIEHILPQKPAAGSPWLSIFSDAGRRQRLCYLLGNHALLTRALNGSAKNYDYAKKKGKMFDINKQQAFPLTTHLNKYAEWDESALLRRHDELTKLARRLMFGATGRY